MQNRRTIRDRKPAEDGFMLLVAIFFMALLVLSLSIAVPEITRQIQRDREVETMHRGKQYQRALQLYYHKFGAYPPNINALVNTNNIKFLRKKYIDPMSGVDDWKPILFGQNKAPLAYGFFGVPLSGGATAIAGVGPGGVGAAAGTPGIGNTTSNGFGSSGFGSSGFGSGSSGLGSSGLGSSGLGSSGFGSSGFGGTNGTSPANGQSPGTGGTTGGSTGSTAGGTSGTDPTNGGTSAGGSTSSGLSSLSGQTFGGGGIIGFSPGRSGASILVFKKMQQYNQWEFTYSPLQELKTVGSSGSAVPGQPTGVNQTGSGFGGSNNTGAGSGFGTGGTGFGGTNSGGTTTGGSGTGGMNNGTGTSGNQTSP